MLIYLMILIQMTIQLIHMMCVGMRSLDSQDSSPTDPQQCSLQYHFRLPSSLQYQLWQTLDKPSQSLAVAISAAMTIKLTYSSPSFVFKNSLWLLGGIRVNYIAHNDKQDPVL